MKSNQPSKDPTSGKGRQRSQKSQEGRPQRPCPAQEQGGEKTGK